MNSNQDNESSKSVLSSKKKDKQSLSGSKNLDDRLTSLDANLKKHHIMRDDETKAGGLNDNSGFAYGLKLGSEFVSAILVGAFIGWAFDTWFQTIPFGLIVFLILGFAAGVLNVMRATGQMQESGSGSK